MLLRALVKGITLGAFAGGVVLTSFFVVNSVAHATAIKCMTDSNDDGAISRRISTNKLKDLVQTLLEENRDLRKQLQQP